MKSKPLFFIHVLVFVIFFKCTTSLSVETLKQSRRCWIHCDFRLGDKLSSGIAPRASYWKSAFGTNIYIYYYIYIQISSSFQMSWYLSLSRWPWQKWVEEALGGDDFWKKRTTMQESEGGPKWNTEKMSKGSICLFFFATRETHAKSYKASNTLLAIQVRVRRWDLLWVSSWESWSGGSENMRATYRIPRILHTLKCPSMLHMKLHEVEVPRFF